MTQEASRKASRPSSRAGASGGPAAPGPVTRYLDTASPEALFVLAAIAQYVGAAIAVLLFDEVAPQTVAWLGIIGAAIAVLAVCGVFWRGWTRAELGAAGSSASPRRR